MGVGDGIVTEGDKVLKDPRVRKRVAEMHERKVPFVEMIEELGLTQYLTPAVKEVIEGLPPDVVEQIRESILSVIDSDDIKEKERPDVPVMPIDCTLVGGDPRGGARVSVADARVIRVRPATGA